MKNRRITTIVAVIVAGVFALGAMTGCQPNQQSNDPNKQNNPLHLNNKLPHGPDIYVVSMKHEPASGIYAEDWYMCVQESTKKNPQSQEVCDPVSKETYKKNKVGKVYIP